MRHSRASLRFILITVFVDMLGIGLMLPVLPSLVGELAGSPDLQSYWYGALMVTFAAAGMGVFPAATGLDDKLTSRYGLRKVADCPGLDEQFFAIATEKRVQHPLVQRLLQPAD